jgi:hypothetical protein
MLVFLVTAGMLLALLLVGIGLGYLARWRSDQRQLGIAAERLLAEQRMEAATRATLAAMRAAVRRRSS